jgi:hypothetical protein
MGWASEACNLILSLALGKKRGAARGCAARKKSLVDVSIGEHSKISLACERPTARYPYLASGPVLVRQMQYLHWAGSWDLALDPNATIQAVVQYCLFITEADPAH